MKYENLKVGRALDEALSAIGAEFVGMWDEEWRAKGVELGAVDGKAPVPVEVEIPDPEEAAQ